MSGTNPTSGATGKTDFTGIVNALQMLAQAIGQNGKALDAIKAALPGSLPAPSPGNALDMVRINAGGTAYEVRTPAQVASDIGQPVPATVAPLVDGTAAVGTSLLYARQDHVHPLPTPTGWQTIASYTPSGAASQAMALPGGFRRYRLTFQDVSVGTSGASLAVQVSTDGGSTYVTGASYNSLVLYTPSGSGTVPYSNSVVAAPQITLALLTSPSWVRATGVFEIVPGNASASGAFLMTGQSSGWGSVTGAAYIGQIGVSMNPTSPVNFIKVFASSGTFTGTFILEGLV